jgi:hypothetical protein
MARGEILCNARVADCVAGKLGMAGGLDRVRGRAARRGDLLGRALVSACAVVRLVLKQSAQLHKRRSHAR